MKNRLSRIRNKRIAVTPAGQETRNMTRELTAPGEGGRAFPGQAQVNVRTAERLRAPLESPVMPVVTGRTDVSTRFTKPGENTLLYQAEGWVYLNVTLIDAGPVSVGTRDDIAPVLSGKGGLLVQNEVFRFPVSKGQRVYITANTISRVRFSIEVPPYLEQILNLLGSFGSIFRKGG